MRDIHCPLCDGIGSFGSDDKPKRRNPLPENGAVAPSSDTVLCRLCGGSVAIPGGGAPSEAAPYLLEACASFDLPGLSGWSLQGHSRAGERTGFWLKPLNIVLDAGMVTNRTPNAIFITHSHVDHSWQLPWIFGCRTAKIKGFEHLAGRPVVAPASAWPMLCQLEQACHNLSVGNMDEDGWSQDKILQEQGVHPIRVQAGQRIEVPGLKDVEVQTMPCYHPAETVAFGFTEMKEKLKIEYQGLAGKDIGTLRKQGVQIYERVRAPRVVFFGDTHIGALQDHCEWKEYPIVIVECTIFPDIVDALTHETYRGVQKASETARAIGHVDWDALLPVIRSHPDNFFIVIHTSQALRAQALMVLERDIKVEGIINFKIWYEP